LRAGDDADGQFDKLSRNVFRQWVPSWRSGPASGPAHRGPRCGQRGVARPVPARSVPAALPVLASWNSLFLEHLAAARAGDKQALRSSGL